MNEGTGESVQGHSSDVEAHQTLQEGEREYSGKAREILLLGSPSLRQSCVPISEVTESVLQLAVDLIATMLEYGGAGLAAPQIGKNLCLLVMRENLEGGDENQVPAKVMVNPKILSREGSFSLMERCLSIPGAQGTVVRSQRVVVSYLNLQGKQQEMEFSNFQAAVVQHELDHLDGKLFIDHLSALQRGRALERYRKVMKKAYRQAKKSL